MGPDPRVLIVADSDDRLGALCEGLDAIGWRTLTARTLEAAQAALGDFPLEVAIIDLDHSQAEALPRLLGQAAADRRLPIIAIGSATAPEGVALAMSEPPHPAQAALRLEHLVRAAVAEEEFVLRQKTFSRTGLSLDLDPGERQPFKVLIAGGADPRYLGLSNALTARAAEVVAAPTPYTAFDYLHETAFDAAVLWGAPDHAPALSIASGMKRNTRLYHIPLTLYLRHPADLNLTELFNRGFADVATPGTPEDEIADRIVALAADHRRHLTVRKALEAARGAGIMDPATGLFTRDLFAAHLARLAEGARLRRRPLSVCVLRVAETDALRHARSGGWLGRAMPQIGAMVSRLVRVEDTAARLAPEVFALALPATSGAAARLAAQRIAAVVGCTAFDAGPDRSPFVAEFDIGTAEVGPGENPASVLERASDDLTARRTRALEGALEAG